MNSRNLILASMLIFFVTLEVLIALDYISKQEQLRNSQISIYQSIIELQKEIGYVGLIHNFKNAILRPDKNHYQVKAKDNFKNALKQVRKLELEGRQFIGEFEMVNTRQMLEYYYSKINQLPELLNKNLTIKEIDQQVRFDDEPSHVEIIFVFHQLIDEFEKQMKQTLSQSLKAGLWAFIFIVLTLIFTVRFYFKEQQGQLEKSNILNNELTKHRSESENAQKILLSVLKDVEQETAHTSALNQKLLIKNKEMEQFIYTVSHDLKSPLVTIGGFAKKLMNELEDTITEKQCYRLTRITENVSEMESLLADLLALSKIVQLEFEKNSLDVTDIINKQSEVLEEAIAQASAQIVIVEPLATIYANERLFSECVLNILSNAINYREPSRPAVISISTSTNETSTSLHIQDNGIGIAPKYHELIFRIFERLSDKKGTGVGLTIVRTIMDKHHGSVTIASELGVSSTFTLTFPNLVSNLNLSE